MSKAVAESVARVSDEDPKNVPGEGVDLLVSMASYEERFVQGLEGMLAKWAPQDLLFLQLEEWKHWTNDQLALARAIAESQSVPTTTSVLFYNDKVRTWQELTARFTAKDFGGKTVCVDISTMPREVIWLLFFLLEEAGAKVYYEYHSPAQYGDWLSRDPGKPRFPFKLSGVSRLGRSTVLLVASGFDSSRTAQLVRTYHPGRVILAYQEKGPYQREEGGAEAHIDAIREFVGGVSIDIESVGINAFGHLHGLEAMTKALLPHIETANVVMASNGPKLTAVALYQMWRNSQDTALAYAPAKEFNPKYSSGLGETSWGVLPLGPRQPASAGSK